MTMSTGAQTKHRAARASALNEMWVEVNSLGGVRDRVARALERYVDGLDACRAGLQRVFEREDDQSRRTASSVGL